MTMIALDKLVRAKAARLRQMSANLRRSKHVLSSPTVLNIETTSACNHRCLTCPRTHIERPDRQMPMDMFQDIIHKSHRDVDFVHLYLLGEPLLDTDLDERIRLCSDYGIATHVATNATLLDEDRALQLVRAGLSAITFTISTTQPDTYRRLHGGAHYGRVIRNVENFLTIKQRLRAPVHVTIQTIRNPQTMQEIGCVANRWRREPGINSIKITQDEFGYLGWCPDDNRRWADAGNKLCIHLWQGPLYIDADGGYFPCRISPLHSKAMANARDMSPLDFWSSEMMSDLREKHMDGILDPHLDCANCPAPKPIASLCYMSYLASAWDARLLGIMLERFAFLHNWRIQSREII